MNIYSQNILLKTFEELPPNRLFIMITDNQDSILPTIKSRSWMIRFNPLSQNDIIEIINKNLTTSDLSIDYSVLNSVSEPDFNLIFEKLESGEKLVYYDYLSLFRKVYYSKFYDAFSEMRGYLILENRNNARDFIKQFYNWADKILSAKNKLSSEYTSDVGKLVGFINFDEFRKLTEYSNEIEYLINSNINLNLIWINFLFKVNKSFKR